MTRYRVVRVPITHPLASLSPSEGPGCTTTSLGEHRVVLYEKVGPGSHPCHWCAQPVHWLPEPGQVRLVTDHLDGDVRNNDPANLVPSCSGCNANRDRKIRPDEPFILYKGKRYRAVIRDCLQCGQTFPVSIPHLRQRPTGGRYCSTSCAALNRAHPVPIGDELFLVRQGKRHRATERVCQVCEKTFLVSLADLKNGKSKGKFCSHSCVMKDTRRRMMAKPAE